MPNGSDSVKIDSRKFLSALNDSAQSKVAVFESRVAQMGKLAGKNWRLAALHAKQLYIEDVGAKSYLIAEHKKESHGRVNIYNIRPLQIVEEEKQGLFTETCLKLINAIEENDQRGMASSFERMKAQRFSARAIPHSGAVKCRDGVLRQVEVRPSNISLEDTTKHRLVSIIVESLRDKVIVENGSVVTGSFSDGEPVNLPVTKWASRKLVARRMLEAAKNAYWSQGFQNRVLNVARLVSESKIEEAVKSVAPFLDDMEEFTLLNKSQIQTLVENALASKAIFNQQLCDDTATLFYRTNMKINRHKIIDEWRNIAKKSEHPALVENVRILEESKNFDNAYTKFLNLIFETISNREVAAEALATTLDVLKNKTPKIRESHDLSSKLNNLITRLKNKNLDDAAIYEAEDLIATIQEELAASDTLQGYDQIPGGTSDALDLGGASGMGALGSTGSGAPVININSPLIQIGGQSSAAGEEEEELPELPEPEMEPGTEAGGDEDLDELLGAGGAAPQPQPGQQTPAAPVGNQPAAAPAAGGAAAPRFESKRKSRRPLSESRPIHYEMKSDEDDDMPGEVDEDSSDPYALSNDEKGNVSEGIRITDYGAPVITDEGDLHRIMSVMRRLATENRLVGKALERNLPSMAKASIKALGIRIPESKMHDAMDQVVSCFVEGESNKPFHGAAAPFKKKGDKHSKKPWESDDSDSEKPWESDDDEGVAEDQYHSARIPTRGFGRASIAKVASESVIKWGQRQDDAILGEYNGVRFIFDHGGDDGYLPPAILSEDGSVEIPIPDYLQSSAFAAADMQDGDTRQFIEWIGESIEQLRPIADSEERALNEAMAKITTGPDGSISVEVTDDVEVGEYGGDDMIADTGDEDIEDSMLPVDSISPEAGEGDGDNEDEGEGEIDFEASDELSDEDELGHEAEEDEDDEGGGDGEDGNLGEEGLSEPDTDDLDEGMAEDNDITNPSNAKYTKQVKGNPREIPKGKIPKAADDELEDIGPTLKKDDGTGTKSPVAKKGN